jgi:transketolase
VAPGNSGFNAAALAEHRALTLLATSPKLGGLQPANPWRFWNGQTQQTEIRMSSETKKQIASPKGSIDELSINTIRTLSMDAVQAAKSGHPGTPMALAPVAYTLWNEFLRFDPEYALWPNRDRFVLSCGHASMLLYSLLHLTGVKQIVDFRVTDELAVPLDAIRNFRQLHSRCPGHPEHSLTTGVETTTGPLGQGLGNSVGMAIAERWLAAHFNRPGFELFGYNVYALCSDGDLMEGVSNEAASIAAHLGLSNLCWIYDDNHITIEGHTTLAFSEDVGRRFEGIGWNVVKVADANDLAALRGAFKAFQQAKDRPTLIIVRSIIAWGAPHKQNTEEAHGSPLGEDEVRATKVVYGWPENEHFLVPSEVPAHFAAGVGARGQKLHDAWRQKLGEYKRAHPDLADQWQRMQARELPPGWDTKLPVFPVDPKGMASRISSGKVLNVLAENIPWLIGGAGDLAPSTMTRLTFDGAGDFEAGHYDGRNFHFGIREHGMAAALNGMSLSYVRPFGSTFFVFTDYMRPSMRLAAIMRLPVIYVLTHDSIGLGEDGPTHQPIEHLAALRAMPNMTVIRPGDANEVAEAWRAIMPLKEHPVALVLSRQNLPTLDRTKFASAAGTARGAYVLAEVEKGAHPELILIGTGSELSVCVAAYERLVDQGVRARLVSMPCWELFDEQDEAYRHDVLPPSVTARLAVEAGVEQGWEKYLGPQGVFVGLSDYGASAPAPKLFEHFGITSENVVARAKALLHRT